MEDAEWKERVRMHPASSSPRHTCTKAFCKQLVIFSPFALSHLNMCALPLTDSGYNIACVEQVHACSLTRSLLFMLIIAVQTIILIRCFFCLIFGGGGGSGYRANSWKKRKEKFCKFTLIASWHTSNKFCLAFIPTLSSLYLFVCV